MTEPRIPLFPFDENLAGQYYICFTNPVGREILDDLRLVHYDRSSGVSPDGEFYPPHAVQQLEGERRVILRILELIEHGRAIDDQSRRRKKEVKPDEDGAE